MEFAIVRGGSRKYSDRRAQECGRKYHSSRFDLFLWYTMTNGSHEKMKNIIAMNFQN